MPIGRPLSLTPNIARKILSVIATEGQTSFSPSGGYRINQIAVFRNGVRLSEARDFTADDGVKVTLSSAATAGDVVEFQIFDSFNVSEAINAYGNQTIQGSLTATDGFNIGIASAGTLINQGGASAGISSMNFVGAGNTFSYNSTTKTVDISIAGGGGGGIGTEIKYESQTKTPFTYIDKYAFVTADLDLNSTTAGATTSYVVAVSPNVTVNSGVAVTVGTGKTMVIDVLKIGDL